MSEFPSDEDDEFLYGPSTTSAPAPPPAAPASAAPSNNVVAKLEAEADAQQEATPGLDGTPGLDAPQQDAQEAQSREDSDEEMDSEDEDDVEIIMEAPVPRSLDLRQQNRGRSYVNPAANRSTPTGQNPSLTTEYQPIQRGATTPSTQPPAPQPIPQSSSTPAPATSAQPTTSTPAQPKGEPKDDGVDPNTLPPATRADSQPEIDPGAVGIFEGRPIIDLDLAALADKPWRRPGADLSDWFNYGFDEISWEAYCYRRRDLGELADVLKANVLNFSGMPEDQLTQLPPEVRQMVMTGTNALMNNAAAGGGMMPNAGMMMDMGGMMDMGMGGGGMGGMGGGGMGGMGGMPMDQQQQQGAAPKQEFEGMEGGMGYGMGMGMGEYGMQDQQQMQQQMGGQMTPQMTGQMNPQMQQQMGGQMPFQGMEGPSQSPPVPAAGRGGPPPFRGRGSLRGRGGFAGRGRGAHVPTPPVRSTSPLPPNVPTGPRNQNKYKDRDNNAQSVDGLDYGGGASARTQSREPDERAKRRASPNYDDSRSSSKRR
ncbi:hypothetical protein EV715DRAFT_295829 [Schizophyllum commune]